MSNDSINIFIKMSNEFLNIIYIEYNLLSKVII